MPATVMPSPYQTVLDGSGNPISGAKIFVYLSGTTTKTDTFTDSNGTTANTNPIIADAAGRFVAFLDGTVAYKFVYALPTDSDPPVSPFETVDGILATTPTSVDVDILGTAGEDLAMNDAVFMSDGSGGNTAGRWYKADADATLSSTAAPYVGMVPTAILSGDVGSIRRGGRITGLAGLSAGADYYISGTAGAITATPPANGVLIGTADSSTSLVILGRIPNASATIAGLMGLGAQAFTGVKTFTNPVLDAPQFTGLPTGIGAPVFSRSTTDATFNANVTLANISGLSFAVGANETWAFDFYLTGKSADAADYQLTLTGPAAPTSVVFAVISSQDAPTTSARTAFGNVVAAGGAAGTEQGLRLFGLLLNGANAGTVQMQAAQLVSDASDTVIRANSFVIATRLA